MELIDKAAVVEEIEKQGAIQPQLSWFTDKLVQIINSSVEMKEVDLEKIIEQTYHDRSVTDTSDMDHVAYENIAHYFYEFGLNTHK